LEVAKKNKENTTKYRNEVAKKKDNNKIKNNED